MKLPPLVRRERVGGEYKMNKGIIIAIVVVVVIFGGIFIANQKSEQAKMAQEKAAMMQKAEDTKMMKEKEDKAAMMKRDQAIDGGKDEAAMMGTGYILKGGKMMMEIGEKMSAMSQNVTLKDGSTVSKTGLVTRKDGTTVQLKEGQSIWQDGKIVDSAMMKEK